MEPRNNETFARSQREDQSSPSCQPDRKPRFQIVRLEERIAPSSHRTNGPYCGSHARTC
jgi:hypothetical protein